MAHAHGTHIHTYTYHLLEAHVEAGHGQPVARQVQCQYAAAVLLQVAHEGVVVRPTAADAVENEHGR